MRRVGGVLAALLLLAGVAFAVFHDRAGPSGITTVRGLIGSEKGEFFADPDVVKELKAQGFKVDVQTTGSWSMASSNLDGYDFAFPSSQPPAEEIRSARHISTEPVRPFYSPLVVIAHEPVARVLLQNHRATRSESGLWTLNMSQYTKDLQADRSWGELSGTTGHAELTGTMYVTTTDPATSSSGALYLAALSYLQNDGGHVVSDDSGVARTSALLRRATVAQGDQKTSSDGPFKDFLSGVGNPLVLVYESQVAALVAQGRSTGDLVVLYPDTTVWSDHTAVALTPAGDRVTRLLRDDAKLRALEARFGFRPQGDPAAFASALSGKKDLVFAPDLAAAGIKQAQVPTVKVLSRLIDAAKSR